MNIPSNNKPMAYESLKILLTYLDPNTRLLMISRIPSIRITGIMREITGRNVPHETLVANLTCGAKFDVNQFGEEAEFSKSRTIFQDNTIEERRKAEDSKKRKKL